MSSAVAQVIEDRDGAFVVTEATDLLSDEAQVVQVRIGRCEQAARRDQQARLVGRRKVHHLGEPLAALRPYQRAADPGSGSAAPPQ